MSDYRIEQALPGVDVLAIWDEGWNSFNNCYLLRDEHGAILVDSGKMEHAAALGRALRELGLDRESIVAVVVTHGHHDHVGGALDPRFAEIPKHIHAADTGLLPQEVRHLWQADLPDTGEVLGLRCVLLGQHTFGSVALFHSATRALFWGDHLCFFGAPPDDEGLVSFGASRRERVLSNMAWRREHWPPDAVEKERVRADLAKRAPEDQQRYNFPLAVDGIRRVIASFTPDVLCTGHGPVLRGDIAKFLGQVVAERR